MIVCKFGTGEHFSHAQLEAMFSELLNYSLLAKEGFLTEVNCNDYELVSS